MSMTLKDAEYYLAERISFSIGNLRAEIETVDVDGVCIAEAYVVRSYSAIIASSTLDGDSDGALSPDAYTWSKTTSKHANIVKKAWGI